MALGGVRQNPYEVRTGRALGTGKDQTEKRKIDDTPKPFETLSRVESTKLDEKKAGPKASPVASTRLDPPSEKKPVEQSSTRLDEEE